MPAPSPAASRVATNYFETFHYPQHTSQSWEAHTAPVAPLMNLHSSPATHYVTEGGMYQPRSSPRTVPLTAPRTQQTSTAPSTRPMRRPSRNEATSEDDAEGGPQRDSLRRVAHSVVEKRRREKIKDKFAHLRTLVPTCATQPNLHKLNVLEHTIDYIHYLRKVVYKLVAERDRMKAAQAQAMQQQMGGMVGAPPMPPMQPYPHQQPHIQQPQTHMHVPPPPPPQIPIPHNPHYMQFDIDLDNLDPHLLSLPPPTESSTPTTAFPTQIPHFIPPTYTHPPTLHPNTASLYPHHQQHVYQGIPVPQPQRTSYVSHHPMAYSAPPATVGLPRRPSTDSAVSSTPASSPTVTSPSGSLPRPKEPSPMRVDNLLC